MLASAERQAYATGVNACIILVETAPDNETRAELIRRLKLLLPSQVMSAGIDYSQPINRDFPNG